MRGFAERVIDWQRDFGRHSLPWQQQPGKRRDPYAIWLSEIMLQQTQVATVVPYYRRFIERFPDVASLATAPLEDVLTLWAGLGYYARARNLHRASQRIVERHGGNFPRDFEAVAQLPGVGRSTAAAICALAYGERRAILDGNVRRLLARCFAIEGDAGGRGDKGVEKKLWAKAEQLLPSRQIERYIQGLMDLGALVCKRAQPVCGACPLRADCAALRTDRVIQFPGKRPTKLLPKKHVVMLILLRGEQVLLEKRAPSGIWGGLWSFPEADAVADLQSRCETRYRARLEAQSPLPDITHSFTHFSLTITPQRYAVKTWTAEASEPGAVWMHLADASSAAVPAPVKHLLRLLR